MDVGVVIGISISLVTSVAAIGVSWGIVTTKMAALEKSQTDLTAALEKNQDDLKKDIRDSREAQGKRIGALEMWRAFVEGRDTKKRRPSRALPIEGSRVPHHEDESGATE